MLSVVGKRWLQRGDTIVEVLFAVTIFSLVAVSGIALMNKGLSTSQHSLEITAVRHQIDSQAEALRFFHDAYIESYSADASYTANSPAGQYSTILADYTVSQASPFGGTQVCTLPTDRKFIVDTKTGAIVASPDRFTLADVYAKVSYDTNGALTQSEGLWVEAVRSRPEVSGGVGFVDFHIRACWDAPGQSVPATLGTIVRLYDPR